MENRAKWNVIIHVNSISYEDNRYTKHESDLEIYDAIWRLN